MMVFKKEPPVKEIFTKTFNFFKNVNDIIYEFSFGSVIGLLIPFLFLAIPFCYNRSFVVGWAQAILLFELIIIIWFALFYIIVCVKTLIDRKRERNNESMFNNK
jgi:hypothetical protein